MPVKPNATTPPPDDFDPDAPLTDDEFERGHAAVVARRARQATGLSQAAFAERYKIPASSLRDWEQGRRKPDAATLAYLLVITRLPDDVAKVLAA